MSGKNSKLNGKEAEPTTDAERRRERSDNWVRGELSEGARENSGGRGRERERERALLNPEVRVLIEHEKPVAVVFLGATSVRVDSF